jgi:hypothetical protein
MYDSDAFVASELCCACKGSDDDEEEYDQDDREYIDPFYITKDFNFISGVNYDQVVIAEIGDYLSYKDAMDKAVKLADERGAIGFFYQ